MYKLYGIPNCDTVKKARLWLEKKGISYQFHNFKKDDINPEKVKNWGEVFDWTVLLNKKGTTWKKLHPDEQAKINSSSKIIHFLKENTSAIKRPILEKDGKAICAGFSELEYEKLFQ